MNTFDSRNELHQLLPWYENGTLHADENAAVRALLATDLEANRQRRELRALRDTLTDDPTLTTNVTLNWRRLQARMGSSHMITYVPMTTHWLAIAALAFLALGVATFYAGARLGPYHTLTAPDPSVPADVELVRVDVVASVDAAALARLADDPEVHVLRGPSDHGVATLAVPRAHAQQVIKRLSADPRLRFVAPVPQ